MAAFQLQACGGERYETRLEVGKPAIEFTARTLEGETISLSDYRGKVVLLDFWATWCGPCLAELPNVKRVYEKYGAEGFVVIGVSLDIDRRKLERFVREHDIRWPQVYDGRGWENDVARLYGVVAIPATLLLDKNGNVRQAGLHGAQLETSVKALIEG